MKKKVGILSMQRIQNYGSFLQAYGLKKILEDIGCDVQFVDYHPGETLIPPDGGNGFKRKIVKAIAALEGSAPLSEKIRFIKYKKNYSKNYYPYLGISDIMNYSPDLDVLVIGSDEVFNCVQNNTNVGFSPELFGQNQNARSIISYAASFGNTTYEKLLKHSINGKIGAWLNKFDAISVRDNNSGKIIRKITEKEPEYNIDPVLAYDYIGKCSNIQLEVEENDYMILYGYNNRFSNAECRLIRQFAKSKGLKIYCIGGVQGCCDKFIDCDPFKVIAYFQHAQCVVTDTFHGSILSIITHRQFVSVVREEGYGNSEKLNDLLLRLNLENRKICDLNNLSSQIIEQIDYSNTEQILAEERKKSYDYLKKWVG